MEDFRKLVVNLMFQKTNVLIKDIEKRSNQQVGIKYRVSNPVSNFMMEFQESTCLN